jgi:hypothetical protein
MRRTVRRVMDDRIFWNGIDGSSGDPTKTVVMVSGVSTRVEES